MVDVEATAETVLANGEKAVWKFGYGSNMSQDYLRTKKLLNPLESRRTILQGFALSFPLGRGIDFVEPSFATLKRDPDGFVHGVSTLFSIVDARELDRQEGVVEGGRTYSLEVCPALEYETNLKMHVEVYVPKNPLPLEHPEGCCSARYRNILVRGAEENQLSAEWISKLQALQIYAPSGETLAQRAKQPSPGSLPSMTIAELKKYDGSNEGYPVYTSACGYIFHHTPIFSSYRGRDVTYRNVLHVRGVNLDNNDDGGKSPFPCLSKLASEELEYALQNRDRFISKSEGAIAVLREFWEEQDKEIDGVFSGNTLSCL